MPNRGKTCKRENCKHVADGGKGYCARHYAAWKRGELPKARYKTCRAEGCRRRVAMRGRCAEHAARDYPGKRTVAVAEAAAEPAPAS